MGGVFVGPLFLVNGASSRNPRLVRNDQQPGNGNQFHFLMGFWSPVHFSRAHVIRRPGLIGSDEIWGEPIGGPLLKLHCLYTDNPGLKSRVLNYRVYIK